MRRRWPQGATSLGGRRDWTVRGKPTCCPGLRRTAGGHEPVGAAIAGGALGAMRDSRTHQHGDGAAEPQKNQLKPWLNKCWASLRNSAEFVCAMKDVLEVYQRSYDQDEVLVCLDETQAAGQGDGYRGRPDLGRRAVTRRIQRNGVSNLFMLFAPLQGLAAGGSDGPTFRADWARVAQGTGGPGLPRQRAYRAGDGQPEHPSSSLAVRGVRAVRSAAHRRTAGDPLHEPSMGVG